LSVSLVRHAQWCYTYLLHAGHYISGIRAINAKLVGLVYTFDSLFV